MVLRSPKLELEKLERECLQKKVHIHNSKQVELEKTRLIPYQGQPCALNERVELISSLSTNPSQQPSSARLATSVLYAKVHCCSCGTMHSRL